MRFLSIICLAGLCGLAITMVFHISNSERKFWAPYSACVIIALLGGIGFGLTWNAERERSVQVERLKVNYEQSQRK